MAKTAAEALWEQGAHMGAEEIVLRQLRRLYGDLPAAMSERVHNLSTLQLEELSLALLDFASLADAEHWIGTRSAS